MAVFLIILCFLIKIISGIVAFFTTYLSIESLIIFTINPPLDRDENGKTIDKNANSRYWVMFISAIAWTIFIIS